MLFQSDESEEAIKSTVEEKERLRREKGLDDFAVREILLEHLGRNLECDCMVLYDERDLRKDASYKAIRD